MQCKWNWTGSELRLGSLEQKVPSKIKEPDNTGMYVPCERDLNVTQLVVRAYSLMLLRIGLL
jgi:hypothetical protein